MKWLKLIIITGAVIIGLLLLVYLMLRSASCVDIDKERFPISGIDISEHTGKVDFSRLNAQGVSFVYIKATEGTNYTDRRFRVNSESVRSSGLPYGFYHFFRFGKSGKVQAEYFLSRIARDPGKLPIVIDVEEWGNSSSKKSGSQVRAEVKSFIDIVTEQTGRELLIYTNLSTYNSMIKGYFSNKIWICAFVDEPDEQINWQFWQHCHTGSLEGVDGDVDFNVFRGKLYDLESLTVNFRDTW